MGTLIFHILLFSVFLLAEVNIKGNMREEDIFIEFPDELPETIEQSEQNEETADETVAESPENRSRQSNIASNRLAATENFFDQNYLNEVEAAKKLVSDVNQQLSREIVNIQDIEMPVSTSEGMNTDSLKTAVYKGESNIVYYLENRYHVSLPVPVYLAQGGGKVIVDILVDRRGNVKQASVRNNPAISDKQILVFAQLAASRTVFNADPNAPEIQTGTIHYTFVAQ